MPRVDKSVWQHKTSEGTWELRLFSDEVRLTLTSPKKRKRHEERLPLVEFRNGGSFEFYLPFLDDWLGGVRQVLRARVLQEHEAPAPKSALDKVLQALLGSAQKVPSNEAVIVHDRHGERRVYFDDTRVGPFVSSVTRIDLRVKPIAIEHTRANALTTSDDFRLDVSVTFYVKLCEGAGAVLQAVDALGPDGIQSPDAIGALLTPKLSELLARAVAALPAETMLKERTRLCDSIYLLMDPNYFGYRVDDVAVVLLRERLHVS